MNGNLYMDVGEVRNKVYIYHQQKLVPAYSTDVCMDEILQMWILHNYAPGSMTLTINVKLFNK